MNTLDIKRHRLATSALSRFNDITNDVSAMPQRMSTTSLFLLQNAFSFLSYYDAAVFESVNSNNKLYLSRWIESPNTFVFPKHFSNLLNRDFAVIVLAFAKALEELAVSYKFHKLKSQDIAVDDKFLLSTKIGDTTYFVTNTGIYSGLMDAIKSTGSDISNVAVTACEAVDLKNGSVTYNFFPAFRDLIISFDVDADKSVKVDAVKYKERQEDESNKDPVVSFTRYSILLLNALLLTK
ncbi:hypothetical protein [Photobacterium leiognathi]|uniref:hypothetical protein n=1 Tax=Photobacterium leiognathi TaxID=553611 RepID=UPI002982AF06|nr:hypothetical protein [Photobacterium leiognathi]